MEEEHPRKANINFKKYTSVEIKEEKIPKNVSIEENLNSISSKPTRKQKRGNRNKSVVAENFLRKSSHGIKQKKNKGNKKLSLVDPIGEDIDTKFMNFNKSHQKQKPKKPEEKKVSSQRGKKKQKEFFYSKSKNAKINDIIENLRKKKETDDEVRYANDNVGKLKINIDSNNKKPENEKIDFSNEQKTIAPKIQDKIDKIGKKHKTKKDADENINNNLDKAPEEFDSGKEDEDDNNDDEIEKLREEIRQKEKEIEKLKKGKSNYKPAKRVMKIKPVRYNSFVIVEEVIGGEGNNKNDQKNKSNDKKSTKKNNNTIAKNALIELNKKNNNPPLKNKNSNIEYQNFNFCYYPIPEENYQSKNYTKKQKYKPEFQTSFMLLRDYDDSDSEVSQNNDNHHKKSIKIKKQANEKKEPSAHQSPSMPIKKKQTNNKKSSLIGNKPSIKINQNPLRASWKLNNKRSSSANKRQSIKDFIKSRKKELFEQDAKKKQSSNPKKINEIIEDDDGVKYIIFQKNILTKWRKAASQEKPNEKNENEESISNDESDNESENQWLYKEFVISHQVSVTLKAVREMEQPERRIKNHILVIHNNKISSNSQNKKPNISAAQKQAIKARNIKKYQQLKLQNESEESSEEEDENENENNNNNQNNKNQNQNQNKRQIKPQPPKKLIMKNPILTNYNESDSDEEEEEEEVEPQPKIVKKPPPPIDKKKLYKKFNDLLLTYEDKNDIQNIQTEPNDTNDNFQTAPKKVIIKDEDYYKHNKTIYSDIYNKEPKRAIDFKKKLSNNKFRKDTDDDSKINAKKVKTKKAKIKILLKDEKPNKKKHYYDDTDNSKIRKNLSTDRRFGDQQNFQLYGKVYSGSSAQKGRNQALVAESNTYYGDYENPIELRRKILVTNRTKGEALDSNRFNNSTGRKIKGRK